MRHYGDITKLSGYELPVVDVITGGSPCQDLSVAGKRAGLAGERSGLFMEQIRIVKEMRERDRNSGRSGVLIRPRYMVWENVPGAFSSKGGEDFAAVIEEIIKVCEPDACVCVCVYRTEDGQNPGTTTLRMEHGQSLGDCMTHNSGACRREESGLLLWPISTVFQRQRYYLTLNCTEKPYTSIFSRLSEILENGPDEKYKLSARACQGILNRAERRGKELPPELKAALIAQANPSVTDGLNQNTPTTTPETITQSVCKETESTEPIPQDATVLDGAGGGVTHSTRSTDRQYAVSRNERVNLGGAKESSFSMSTPEPCQPSTTSPSLTCGNPWDSQSERVYTGDGAWHSVAANESGGQSRDAILAFAQNQRNEVRDLNDIAGALAAEPGMKQQTFIKQEAYSFDSLASNSMKSGNPNSGCRKVETSKTLDCSDTNPAKNQGGLAIVATAVDCRNGTENPDVNGTLQAKDSGGISLNCNNVVRQSTHGR